MPSTEARRRPAVLPTATVALLGAALLGGAWIGSVLLFQKGASRATAIRLSALAVRVAELEARRAEKDFMLRSLDDPEFFAGRESEFLGKQRDSVERLRREVERLGELIPAERREEAREVRKQVDHYAAKFEELVEAHRRLGFLAAGMEGAWTAALVRIEDEVVKIGADRVSALALELRRGAEEFFRRKEPHLADRMLSSLGRLREEGRLAPGRLTELAGDGEKTLREYLGLLAVAGAGENEGVQREFRAAIRAIEPTLEALLEAAVATDENAQRKLVAGIAVAGIVMTGLLVLTVFLAQAARTRSRDLLAANRRMHEDMEARRAAESRFRKLLEGAPDAMLMVSRSGRIVLANAQASRLFGYSRDELLRLGAADLLRTEPDGRDRAPPETAPPLAGAVPVDAPGHQELLGVRKDGGRFPIEVTSSPLETDEGLLILNAVRDVSERRDMLLSLAEKHRQLLQAERLAAIGQMVTGLAHESRNALQRSQACLDMLAHRVRDNPKAVELVSRVQDAQSRLHHLYEEVRGYAAPLRLDRRSCRLHDVLQKAWDDLALERDGRNATLEQEPVGGAPPIPADPVAMDQVFRNILENSLAACGDPVRIEARWSSAGSGARRELRVSIRDNGPGFTPEARQHVFEPFFTTKTKGTGLGMAIARRLVEAHGGTVEVGAGESRGAEVVITLPAGEDAS